MLLCCRFFLWCKRTISKNYLLQSYQPPLVCLLLKVGGFGLLGVSCSLPAGLAHSQVTPNSLLVLCSQSHAKVCNTSESLKSGPSVCFGGSAWMHASWACETPPAGEHQRLLWGVTNSVQFEFRCCTPGPSSHGSFDQECTMCLNVPFSHYTTALIGRYPDWLNHSLRWCQNWEVFDRVLLANEHQNPGVSGYMMHSWSSVWLENMMPDPACMCCGELSLYDKIYFWSWGCGEGRVAGYLWPKQGW